MHPKVVDSYSSYYVNTMLTTDIWNWTLMLSEVSGFQGPMGAYFCMKATNTEVWQPEIRRWRSPPGMVQNKPVVNNGISTTCPSTGELIPDFWLPSTVCRLYQYIYTNTFDSPLHPCWMCRDGEVFNVITQGLTVTVIYKILLATYIHYIYIYIY